MKRKVGFVFAMKEEAAPLLARLNLSEAEEEYPGGFFYDGESVAVGVGDIGSLAAALCTETLIRRYGCSFIINAGTAGSTGPGLPVGKLVCAGRVFKGDVDLTVAGYPPYTLPRESTYLYPEQDASLEAVTVRSADRFIGKNDVTEPDLAVEMEGYAVAFVCTKLGVPYRLYKVISDMVANNNDDSQQAENVVPTSEQLADFLIRVLAG